MNAKQEASQISETFSADHPIKSRKQDEFGRRGFAENLAKEIKLRKLPDSLVIGLYGEWGSGKSSILNMLADAIKDPSILPAPHPIVIQFNPWLYVDQTSLAREFFESIASEFGRSNKTGNLRELQDSFESLAKLSDKASVVSPPKAKIAKYVLWLLGLAFRHMRAIKEDIVRQREEIRRQLINTQQPLLIIVDDIDRLTANEVLLTFQMVKSLADFPYTTYLLAFDDVVVAKALDGPTCGSGKDFIEKIVQVPIAIPETPKGKIRNYIGNHLDEMIRLSEPEVWDESYWRAVDRDGFWVPFCTIRNAKRYVNTLSLKSARLKNECCLIDIWLISLFQLFYPGLYRALSRSKSFLTQDFSEKFLIHIDEASRKKSAVERLDEILMHVPENRRKTVKKLLIHMFPAMGSLVSESPFHNSMTNVLRAKRIAAPENFVRYFLYDLPEDEVTVDELAHFVNLENVEDAFNFASSMPDKREDLFVRVEEAIPEMTVASAKTILEMLLRKSDSFQVKPNIIGGVRSSIYRISNVILSTKVEPSDRILVLRKPFEHKEHALVLLELLHGTLLSEHEQKSESHISDVTKRTLQKDELGELKEKLDSAFEFEYSKKEIEEHPHLLRLAFMWHFHYGGKDKAAASIRRICQSDSALIKLLHDFRDSNYKWKDILHFFELNDLKRRLAEIRKKPLSTESPKGEIAFINSWITFLESEEYKPDEHPEETLN